MAQWIPGTNHPLIGRGGVRGGLCVGRGLCDKSRLILGNVIWNLSQDAGKQEMVRALSASGGELAILRAIAKVTGMSLCTLRNVARGFEKTGWKPPDAGQSNESVGDNAPASGGEGGKLAGNISQNSSCDESTNYPLPILRTGEAADAHSDSESDYDIARSGGRPLAALDRWKQHANYNMALRHAEMTAFWITAGLPEYRWEEFATWFQTSTGQGADINQSKHWVREFGHSLSRTIMSRTAVTVHSIIPALGLPSDYARVIDVVTLSGISLLVVVAVHVDPAGRLAWSLFGCPALGSLPASGGTSGALFRFHSGAKLVELVHMLENTFRLGRKDRLLRLVMTMADGAIQGLGSVDFEGHEAKIDGRGSLHAGVCGFHRLDNAGGDADRQFAATIVYDRFLRLVRQHFAWGTGLTVLRATASEFARLAKTLEEQAQDKLASAAKAEAEGRPDAAARYRKSYGKLHAHAWAFDRAGWTIFRRPLAPKADGTRKVVWQTSARQRLFESFPLIYWGVRVRMMEALGTAHETVRKRGKTPTEDAGKRTKQMKMWRAIGRTLCDIHMLVFNIGRSDFRTKHATPMAMLLQVSTHSALETQSQIIDMSFAMFDAIGMLMDMLAIVHFLEMVLERRPASGGHLTKEVLWATARTLMAHRCWRKFPGLTRHLPHILLGGTMQGVSLQDNVFEEPPPKSKSKGPGAGQPAIGGNEQGPGNRRLEAFVRRRRERFGQVKHALEVLVSWAKCERKCFEAKVLMLPPPPQPASKQPVKKQERDVTRAERIGQGECDNESTDDEAANTINLTASGVQNTIGGLGKSSFYEMGEEQHEALDLEAESVAFFKITAPPDTTQKLYQSGICNHMADTAPSILEEEDGIESGEETADDQPGACSMPGSGRRPGRSNNGDNASRAPATGGIEEDPFKHPAKDWVVVKKRGRPAQIMERNVWKHEKVTSMVGILPAREKALYMYGQAFGGEVLFGDEEVDCTAALVAIHSEFDGKLWGLREEDVAPCVKSIPAEILESCSRDQFVEEYDRFRTWLRALKGTAFAREFYILDTCSLRKQSGRPLAADNVEEDACFVASRKDIIEATDDNFIPRVGGFVHSKRHGKCQVEAITKRVSSTKLLRYIMTTPYSEISCLKIHRVVHSYLRCTLLALPSESLAESVGSVLTDAAQKATGKPKEVDAFIQATIIRLAGLRGHGGEEGILADALNTHFSGFGQGPEAWHFKKTSRAGGEGCVVHKRIELQRSIRLQHCQPWVATPLVDVVRCKSLRPCKILPGPESFYRTSAKASSSASGEKRPCSALVRKHEEPAAPSATFQKKPKLSASGEKQKEPAQQCRRESLQLWRQAHRPSVLPSALWRCMNATTMSIGKDFRPGQHFR